MGVVCVSVWGEEERGREREVKDKPSLKNMYMMK